VVAGYELLGELGHGGMGVVYKARQLSLDRLVALKMIRDGVLATAEQRLRFQAEARAVARLQHPNVVQIYEIAEQDGRPYFSLELVEGGNLAQRVAVVPLPPSDAARLVETLARAMHHAHSLGIVHRDLKPANVLLAPGSAGGGLGLAPASGGGPGGGRPPAPPGANWVPKITDFGLAKELEAEVFLTHTTSGVLMGTPSYMAPEQAWGKTRQVGPAADVYALGAILYECLTGRPPFVAAKLMEVLDQVRNQEPTRPTRLRPEVPHDLETICLKCLEKEPGRRYGTAQALADELRRFLDGQTIHARRAGVLEKTVKWARRRPTAAALTLVTVAVVLLVALGGWEMRRSALERRRERYPADIEQAQQAVTARKFPEAGRLLDATLPDQRGWEWQYLRGLCDGNHTLEWRAHEGPATALAHGARAAVFVTAGGADNTVRRWDEKTGRGLARYLTPPGWVTSVALSPDNETLAVAVLRAEQIRMPLPKEGPKEMPPPRKENAKPDKAEDKSEPVALLAEPVGPADIDLRMPAPSSAEVMLLELRTGRARRTLPRIDRTVTAVAFSPDSRYLATATGQFAPAPLPGTPGAPPGPPDGAAPVDKRAGRLPAPGTANRWAEALVLVGTGLLEEPPGPRQAPPEGKGRQEVGPANGPVPVPESGRVTLWDITTGKEAFHLDTDAPVQSVAFHPHEPYLAAACGDGVVQVWDLDRRRLARSLRGHTGRVRSVAYSPAGDRLASAGDDETVRLWDGATGDELFSRRDHTGSVTCLSFHPDGRRLASGSSDRKLKIWDVATGRGLLTLHGHHAPVSGVAFGGACLASCSADGSLILWGCDAVADHPTEGLAPPNAPQVPAD
jgi:hypothetical protein